jgi:hypothetical protein
MTDESRGPAEFNGQGSRETRGWLLTVVNAFHNVTWSTQSARNGRRAECGTRIPKAFLRRNSTCRTGEFNVGTKRTATPANPEKRHAANIFSIVGLVSTVAARRANDHEGLMALLRH